jgi:hypothetical protein
LTANTALLGVCIAQFACVTSDTPALVITAMATIYGLLASLQFSCLNVLSFVDIAKNELGDATSLAATVQQFSTSFGVGLSALLLLLLRGEMPLTGAVGVFHATLLCMGFLTFLSSLTFLFLDETAGNVSSGFVPHRARHK